MEIVKVKASKNYDILIDHGLLDRCGELIAAAVSAKRIAVVTDDNVDRYYGQRAVDALQNAGLSVVKYVFPHGEASKSHAVLLRLYDFLAENGFTRSDLLVALGGGVVGDLTGFAAATYMRGIEFVQIPTTVLSQVDSSVGGKTAVDISGGKNLVGAFHQPSLVICDIDTLDTLTPEFFADGMAEVVKYGMIKSAELFAILSHKDIKSNMTDIIKRCVTIKAEVVANDEFDRGERALLNFGHTLGHAIEKHYDFSGISHGYAVAIGMSTFTHIAESKGMCPVGTAEKLDVLLNKCALPMTTDIPMDILYKYSLGDKKRSTSGIDIIICNDIGESTVTKMTLEEYAAFLGVN
ncbi:MAG: 3-dehydroquinate synthase [Ruminococcaceae bacterium]|nr:3-dehydroquinate synthase [Oscillospiraceae bacterium]